MLDKFFWNILISKEAKKQIVEQYGSPPSKKTRGKFFASWLYQKDKKLIENYHLIPEAEESEYQLNYSRLDNDSPFVFSLLQWDENALWKIQKLFQWGLDKNIVNKHGNTLLEEILYVYHGGYLSLEKADKYIQFFLSEGVSLLGEENKNRLLSYYEKAQHYTALLKEKEYFQYLIENKDYINHINKIEKLTDWLDNKLLTSMLESNHLSLKDKMYLDYLFLRKVINEIQMQKYVMNFKGNLLVSHISSNLALEIERILDRSYVFMNQNTTYHALKNIFSLDNVEEIINNRIIYNCYEKFNELGVVAKKSLTSQLILRKKETVIFNLLSHGLNINWSIKNHEGKENIVAFEVLYSLPMIRMILSSENFNLCITNTRGDNLLHLMGSMPLLDSEIKASLDKKINLLNRYQKHYLFNQINSAGVTPLEKAICLQEEVMINYLKMQYEQLEGFNGEILGLPKEIEKGLNFIQNNLLKENPRKALAEAGYYPEAIWAWDLDENYINFWQQLSKQWNTQHLHGQLQQDLRVNHSKAIRHKI